MVKRLFDIVVAALLLLAACLPILVVALLVRFKLGAPVVFRQQRPGLHGAPFYVYKFRTMTDERDSLGKLLPDHLRLTAFGAWLRKYSLDELLQLVNVLKGELSLIGPRPLLMEYLPLYSERQAKRHLVRPGITGWAQINGRNATTWEERFEHDVWYVEHQSLRLDMLILLRTAGKVIRSEGVSKEGHVTMPMFVGSSRNHEA
jgi:sugar transferase EpsL